ncbi:DUF3604 domain-containing protein [Acuticoccus sediminis]|uniref:DUF3604 domain-containing protein n=1 Tax=Acuticoccus sediminis TaxID=2184697 RepID=UPI001CFE2ECD|nr:DUF3604 domain-containing protein [Acuticoccus sediminis]
MKPNVPPQPIRRALVGENAPSVRPGDDPTLYGSATLEPVEAVETRTFQTFRLTYTVGRIGLDDTGAIRISFRSITDAGRAQSTDPGGPNYVSAVTDGEAKITLRCGPEGPRPWAYCVTAQVNGGYLKEGETITLTFGDMSRGSPGMLMQTFAEHSYEFRVATDVQATGNFLPLSEQFVVPVVAGPAHRWAAVMPTLRRPGEPFHLGLKSEDRNGNPTQQAKGRVRLEPSLPVTGLDLEFDYAPGDRSMVFEGLSVAAPGTLRIKVFVDDALVAEAGPLVVEAGDHAGFWGDLHGQTGETIGVNTIESYFDFARNKAFLDVSAHQGNDFQINLPFWARLNELTAEWNEPGRFTVFPGYEWSGNTAVGGDHNVYFATEGRTIARCSHAILEDRSDLMTDANTLTDLYDKLRGEDCVIYAHVGGRYANIFYDHDPKLETAVEMHSAWGTFEWILTDGFPLGRRVGVVCNSDGHKGRPGASYPGASRFGAYGGLTCFLTDRNDRASIMEAQRRRHHYGTTGCRLFMDVTATLPDGSVVFERNPAADPDAARAEARTAIMGDIVRVAGGEVTLAVRIEAHAGIERVELRDGAAPLEVIRTYGEEDLGNRIRVLWAGAEYRGRGRDTLWTGRARFAGASIDRFETVNHWNKEQMLEQRGGESVSFKGVTTGNFMGFDAWLTATDGSVLTVETNRGTLERSLAGIGLDPIVMDAGGLDRRLSVQRLPEARLARSLSFERTLTVKADGDTPIWIAVTTEDGFQAWSSPIYLFR